MLASLLLLSACGGSNAGTAPAPGAAQAGAGSSAPAPAPSQSKALQPESLLLDWVVNGEHAAFYLGIAKGFYKDAGIDLTIVAGKGSVSTTQQVGHGNYPFGIADASVAANGISKGINVKVVADYLQKSPDGLIVLADSGISKPADLIGKKVAYAPGGASADLFQAFEAANHIQAGQITVVTTGPENLVADLAQKKVDAIGDFATDVIPPMEEKGIKATTLYYADWGAPVLSAGLIVNTDYMKAHPDVVKAMVQATAKAWEYTAAHPDEAVAATKAAYAQLGTSARAELDMSLQLLHSPNTKDKPIGWMSPDDWKTTLEILQKYENVKDIKSPDTYYTDEFIAAQG